MADNQEQQRSVLPYLQNDVARCRGVGEGGEWREGCEVCARRLAPGAGDRTVNMEPPTIIVFECAFFIDERAFARS